jgi:asparagine synthase (glutamine-hydrolysing)
MQDTGMMNNAFRVKYASKDQTRVEANLQTALWKSEMEYGLKELLRYEDRNSMAFSIETRTPFVDYRLVEYVFSLPACYKIHDGWTKYLLRVSTEGLIPEVIRWRKDKLGFPTPETAWMRLNRDSIREIFAGRDFRAGSYLNSKKILENLDKQLDKGSPASLSVLWKPLNLELWMRKMFS